MNRNRDHTTDMRRTLGGLVARKREQFILNFPDNWDELRAAIPIYFHDVRYMVGFYNLIDKGETSKLKPSDFPRLVTEFKRRVCIQSERKLAAMDDSIARLGSMVGDYREPSTVSTAFSCGGD